MSVRQTRAKTEQHVTMEETVTRALVPLVGLDPPVQLVI
jgi:hypothetical protein